MKREKIKYILLIMLIGITVVMPKVYAKTSIEIKPNSSTVYTNKTISEFFDETMAMKNSGEGLEGSDVDVHMATSTDWAIVSYFSNSAYGTNGEGDGKGVITSINGRDYYSTNGNVTGVMDFGKQDTFTASVISNYTDISDTSEQYANGRRILENVTNNKYVDLLNFDNAKRAAITSVGYIGKDITIPYPVRAGLFYCGAGFNGKRFYWKC